MHAVSVIDLYDRLTNAPDERTRAKVIAEAFEVLEARYPHLPDLATRQHLSETELKLIREIEQVRAELKVEIEHVRAELKETELKLTREIEQVRAALKVEIEQVQAALKVEIEQVRAELKAEIEQVRSELKLKIEQVRGELKVELARTRANLLQWTFVFWLTQFAAILAILWRVWPQAG